MRTNIVLDDDLMEQGLALTNLKTKRELVNLALKELVNRERRKALLALEGKLHWEGNLDEMRKNRFEDTG
ncbi:MAG: type II toxin-antitoxin system VapB family antitoxin [Deltaproteobacteria bacterium]|nr:type II toxin-antitoxin system VapB family antitoxin [Deltaproteobacteria bacterium]